MSAGICIMNKNAVALAADSAVTIGNHAAIHNSANKLFMLSDYEPVGVIIYANASFMEIPVEIIIKEYKKQLGKKSFPTLVDYVNDFISYLSKNSSLFRFKLNEERYVKRVAFNLLAGLKNDYGLNIKNKVEKVKRELTNAELAKIQKESLKATLDYVKNLKSVSKGSFSNYIYKNYYECFKNLIKSIFDWVSDFQSKKLIKALSDLYDLDFYRDGYVGISIAGYGTKEIFPQMAHYKFGGMINGKLRYKMEGNYSIDEKHTAYIIPLAQTDVMYTFLFGINDTLIGEMAKTITNKLEEKMKSIPNNKFAKGEKKNVLTDLNQTIPEVVKQMVSTAYDKYMDPIQQSVATLPINELVSFAESMISITTSRRQIAIDDAIGTVGGPIDVSVLTKGEGFVWIKRKQYYDSKYNTHLLYNVDKTLNQETKEKDD